MIAKPFVIERIDHIFLRVRNLSMTIEFYTPCWAAKAFASASISALFICALVFR
jgi:hypothetical protein